MFPQIFHIGPFFLPTYGVLVAFAFVMSLWIVSRLSRRAGIDKDAAMNLGIYTVIAGLVGAKLLMILLDLPYYTQNPGELFSLATLQAGGIFYGGLIAALLTAYFYVRRTKLPGLVTADVFAPAVALGHAIGRVGCFAAGCCYGGECHLPWAVTFTSPEANSALGSPARTAAASDPALRGARRGRHLCDSVPALPQAAPPRDNHRAIPDVVLDGPFPGGIRPRARQ